MAKEGLQFSDEGDDANERLDELDGEFKPLTTWLKRRLSLTSLTRLSCLIGLQTHHMHLSLANTDGGWSFSVI